MPYVSIIYDDGVNPFEGSFELNEILLSDLVVTKPPNRTSYIEGEEISYDGMVVMATFSDDTTEDVTNKCVITPPEGSVFEGSTYAEISYTEGPRERSCSLELEEDVSSSLIQITNPPDKTMYLSGENIDYAGIIVSAVYDDGTQHDVTACCDFEPAQKAIFTSETNRALISCAPPLVPYVYDLHIGSVYYDRWIYDDDYPEYSDVYKVKAGHTYLIALGAVLGNMFSVLFITRDVTTVRGTASGVRIISQYEPEACADVTYTPSEDGYIVVDKSDWEQDRSGLRSYVYDAMSSEKTETVFQRLYGGDFESLEVAELPKTVYINGDPISYEGLVVMGVFSNGASLDVTDICTFTPKAGKSYNPATYTEILITLGNLSASIPLQENMLSALEVTRNLNRMTYKAGDVINYAGMIITGVYDDGTKRILTDRCAIQPPQGSLFDPSETSVLIKYDNVSTNIELTEDTSTALTLQITSMPNKVSYKSEEELNYSGLVVKALYDNGTEVDVTEQCTMTPAAGEPFARYVDIAYNDAHVTLELTEVYVERLGLIKPSKLYYKEGEQLDFTGLSVTAEYSNHTTADVTDQCFYSHNADEKFDPINNYIWIYYKDACTYFVLQPLSDSNNPIYVAQEPNKMSYSASEVMDYTGIIVKMQHDGIEHDVTDICDFNPPQGAAYSDKMVAISCAPPLEPYLYDITKGCAGKGVWWGDYNNNRTDIYRVQAGLTYTLMTSGENDFRAVFSTTDLSQTTATIACEYIANTEDCELDDVYTYTPEQDGYIAITKGYGIEAGTKTYVYAGEKTETTTLEVNRTMAISVTSLPLKTIYYPHEVIDYNGLVITYTHDDGTTEDITSSVTIYPMPGTVINSDVKGIYINYNGIGMYEPRVKLLLQCPRELKLVSPPEKTYYEFGDTTDYTGIKINAVYTDGTERDITDDCVFSPQSGSVMAKGTIIKATYMGLSLVLNNPAIKNIDFISCVGHNNTIYPYLFINYSVTHALKIWGLDYYGNTILVDPPKSYSGFPTIDIAKLRTQLEFVNPEAGTVSVTIGGNIFVVQVRIINMMRIDIACPMGTMNT